ncbi:MAG TPA: hypothetical protein VNK26_02090, partial [Pyrinomonadaceae bacterium]|nr:hypothetical protein [Pyrinomonadaceae bacterium]
MRLDKESLFSILFLFALAVLGSSCGQSATSATTNNNTQSGPVEVSTEAAVIRPIPTYIEATGSLVS